METNDLMNLVANTVSNCADMLEIAYEYELREAKTEDEVEDVALIAKIKEVRSAARSLDKIVEDIRRLLS